MNFISVGCIVETGYTVLFNSTSVFVKDKEG